MVTGSIEEHMPVFGFDGQRVGFVGAVEADAVLVTAQAPELGGARHRVPLDWVDCVAEGVYLTRPADVVREAWDAEAAGV